MRIAIFGGTFNPIHIGHTSLAQSLTRQGLVDEVWLMVSPQNPLKGNDAADYNDRLSMARIATKGMKGIIVSDFERHLPIPSYTITTLTRLSEAYPQHQFSLVIGADNWESFTRWFQANEIMTHYPILIYQRPGYVIDLTLAPEGSDIRIVNTPIYDVSSTEIRNHQKPEMINPDVLEYIRVHKLYF